MSVKELVKEIEKVTELTYIDYGEPNEEYRIDKVKTIEMLIDELQKATITNIEAYKTLMEAVHLVQIDGKVNIYNGSETIKDSVINGVVIVKGRGQVITGSHINGKMVFSKDLE